MCHVLCESVYALKCCNTIYVLHDIKTNIA